jgi:hypothetical protein
VFIGTTGALLAYIILSGELISTMLSSRIEVEPFYCSLFFVMVLAPFIFNGMKVVAKAEVLTNALFFIIIFAILIVGFPNISLHNFSLISLPNILLPYGVVMFSFVGFSAIPEAEAILQGPKEKRNLKNIILVTFGIAIAFYMIFSFVIVGISGNETSPDVFRGLIPFLGPEIVLFGALAATITVADSFLVVAIYLKHTLVCDQKISNNAANYIVVFLPVILFLLGFRSFIDVIGFLGTIIGVIEGIIIILLFGKAKKLGNDKPEYEIKVPKFLLYVCALVLILGAVFQFFN